MQRHGLEFSVYTDGEIHLADFWLLSDAMAFAKVANWVNGCKIWSHKEMKWLDV